jgi:uncharacterized repeat protein (TIGR01451 family)
VLVLFFGVWALGTAQAGLTIEPTTWNVVGLDSNNTNSGPATFPVGARVCNTGGATVTNLVGSFVWDSFNTYINLSGASTLNVSSLAAGACVDFYFPVTITRTSAAYDATRRYHITVTGDSVGSVSTPTPREIYVERIISQGRNAVNSITGPTTVYVGQTYTYTVNASTATGGYEQLQAFLELPNVIFQVQSIATTYTAPSGGTNDKFYADACGWDNNPLSGSYRSCIGPEQYPGGKAGGTVVTTYTVKVISAGTTTAGTVILDFSGSSYHYNNDYGSRTISITALPPPLTLSKIANPATATAGATVTYTLRVVNSGPPSYTLTDFVDTPPTSPASPTYVAGSSTFNGAPIADPVTSGSTRTWTGSFVVPANQTRDLTYQMVMPDTPGAYVNTAIAHFNEYQIDTTQTTTDNAPATATVTIPPPDMTITKTHTGNFTQGQVGATYSITATNSGSSSTNGSTVTVTDTLPAGLTPTAPIGAHNGWTCGIAGQTVTCTRSNVLAAGSSYPTITITVTVANNAPASVTNSVSVSGGGQTNTANDTASDPTTINQLPDMTITKSHLGNFTQGQVGAQYTITATNSGSAATNGSTVTVTDTLPAGLTPTAPIGAHNGWTCGIAGQTVTCTRSNVLAAGSSYPTITITVTVANNAPASVTNSVSVSGGGQTNTGNDTASDPTTINQLPDMTITKSHSGNFTQGQVGAQYTITATNSGSAATNGSTVTVTDTLPAGLTPTAPIGTHNGWTCGIAGQTVTCTRTDVIGAGLSYPTITITVTVANNAPASVTNSVSVSGGGQTNTANDTASDPTTINQLPDMTITKSHLGNFTQGQVGAQYTITATNSGSAATNGSTVTVTDTLPAGLTPTAPIGAHNGWTCGIAGQTVTCTRSNVLAAGSSYPTITITVTVANNAPASVTNSVSVSGGGQTNTGNDTASDPTTINQLPDMTITKSHSGNFTQGQVGAQYTLTATNSGSAATNGSTVTVTDTLPAGLTPTAPIGAHNGWTCGIAGQTVTCTRTDVLGAGLSYPTITITVTVANNAPASVTNSVSVSGGGQTNTANDTASDPTTINQLPDMTITKSHSGNFTQGQVGAQYTITATNSGTAATNGSTVTVTDTLPAGLTPTAPIGAHNGWTCGIAGQTVTCTRSDVLAAGSSYPAITLTVNVSLTAPGSVTNSATVSGGGQTNTANDTANDPTTINTAAPPDIVLVKSVNPNGSQAPGTDLNYTIVYTNNGGQPATTFILVDPNAQNADPLERVFHNVDFKVGSMSSTPGSTGLVASFQYSNDGGLTWTYTPVSGGGSAPAGYDRNVTNVRWVFAGSLSHISPNNSGSVDLVVRIR